MYLLLHVASLRATAAVLNGATNWPSLPCQWLKHSAASQVEFGIDSSPAAISSFRANAGSSGSPFNPVTHCPPVGICRKVSWPAGETVLPLGCSRVQCSQLCGDLHPMSDQGLSVQNRRHYSGAMIVLQLCQL